MTSLPVSPGAFNALACLAHDAKIPKSAVIERLLAAAVVQLYFADKNETANERAARFHCLFPDGFRHLINNRPLGGPIHEDQDEEPIHNPA